MFQQMFPDTATVPAPYLMPSTEHLIADQIGQGGDISDVQDAIESCRTIPLMVALEARPRPLLEWFLHFPFPELSFFSYSLPDVVPQRRLRTRAIQLSYPARLILKY